YPRLPGHPAAVVDMEIGDWAWRFDAQAPPDAFLDSLAAALAGVHGIDAAAAGSANVLVLRPDDIRAVTAERVARARDTLTVPDPLWRRWHDWIDDDASWPSFATFVHGDLHPGHVLVGDDHRVTGVIDWS